MLKIKCGCTSNAAPAQKVTITAAKPKAIASAPAAIAAANFHLVKGNDKIKKEEKPMLLGCANRSDLADKDVTIRILTNDKADYQIHFSTDGKNFAFVTITKDSDYSAHQIVHTLVTTELTKDKR